MKSIPLHVRISTVQVVTLSGKNILSVELSTERSGFLEVVKKRFRGGVYDKQFYPLSRVVSYSVGDGGKDGTAYATLQSEILIKELIGTGIIDNDIIRLVDDKSVTHEVNLKSEIPNLNVSVTQPKFKEIEVEEEPVKRRLKEKPLLRSAREPLKVKDEKIVRRRREKF